MTFLFGPCVGVGLETLNAILTKFPERLDHRGAIPDVLQRKTSLTHARMCEICRCSNKSNLRGQKRCLEQSLDHVRRHHRHTVCLVTQLPPHNTPDWTERQWNIHDKGPVQGGGVRPDELDHKHELRELKRGFIRFNPLLGEFFCRVWLCDLWREKAGGSVERHACAQVTQWLKKQRK